MWPTDADPTGAERRSRRPAPSKRPADRLTTALDTGAFYEKMSEIEEGAFSAEVELIPVLPQSLSNVPYDVIAPAGLSCTARHAATATTTMASGGGLAMPVAVVGGPASQKVEYHFHQSFNAGGDRRPVRRRPGRRPGEPQDRPSDAETPVTRQSAP